MPSRAMSKGDGAGPTQNTAVICLHSRQISSPFKENTRASCPHGCFRYSVHDPTDPDALVQQVFTDEDLEHIHAHAEAVERQDGQAGEAAQ